MARIVFCHFGQEHLGIEYLAAELESHGNEVALAFERLAYGSKSNWQQLAEKVLALKPDIVAFAVFTETLGLCNKTAEFIKRMAPECPVAYGGIHPSIAPVDCARLAHVDVVFHGEALVSFPAWVDAWQSGKDWKSMPGVALRLPNGHIQVNNKAPFLLDLSHLPVPKKELFASQYPDLMTNYMVMAGFGCPYQCTFCEHSVFRDYDDRVQVRTRPVDVVLEEISNHKSAIRYVFFCDEVFGLNLSWLEEFSEKYPKQIGIPFHANLNPLMADKRRVELIARAGCDVVSMGVQTASDRIRLQIYNRRETWEKIVTAAGTIRSFGLKYNADRLLGNPLETEEELVEAVSLFKKLRPNRVTVYWLSLYPNLPILDVFRKRGVLLPTQDLTSREDGSISFGLLLPEGKQVERHIPFAILHVLTPILPSIILRALTHCRRWIPQSKFLLYSSIILVSILRGDLTVLVHGFRTLRDKLWA